MRYILTVSSTEPLWHDLKAFDGYTYKRRDHALYGLRHAVYEAMRGASLLDRPVAHRLYAWLEECEAKKLPRPGHLVENEGAGFTFRLTTTA